MTVSTEGQHGWPEGCIEIPLEAQSYQYTMQGEVEITALVTPEVMEQMGDEVEYGILLFPVPREGG